MKFLIAFFLGLFLINQKSFAICEKEREQRDHYRKLVKTWSEISVVSSSAGSAVGSCAFGPAGGLCGAIGILPGAMAANADGMLWFKERALQNCEEHYAFKQRQQDEKRKDDLADKHGDLLGECVFGVIQRATERLKIRCLEEIDDLVQYYINSGKDLSNRVIVLELDAEIKRIKSRYF